MECTPLYMTARKQGFETVVLHSNPPLFTHAHMAQCNTAAHASNVRNQSPFFHLFESRRLLRFMKSDARISAGSASSASSPLPSPLHPCRAMYAHLSCRCFLPVRSRVRLVSAKAQRPTTVRFPGWAHPYDPVCVCLDVVSDP